jgi:hypothetical protein
VSWDLQATFTAHEEVAIGDYRHHLLIKCVTQALVLNPKMAVSNIPSPLTLNDPRVHHEPIPAGDQPASGRRHTTGISEYELTDLNSPPTESAAVLPQLSVLPSVDEEDTMTAEDKLPEAASENREPESGSSNSGPKLGSIAGYKGKRDPFANEGGGGMEYKTMAWWYVMTIQALKLDFHHPKATTDRLLS